MADLVTTIVDAFDALIRRVKGQRLCAFCNHWAKKPHSSGGLFFCDAIHASVHFKKQQEVMRQALEKKRSPEKPAQEKEKAEEGVSLDLMTFPRPCLLAASVPSRGWRGPRIPRLAKPR